MQVVLERPSQDMAPQSCEPGQMHSQPLLRLARSARTLAPTVTATLHGDVLASATLLPHRECQAILSREILSKVLLANPRPSLAIQQTECAMEAIFDASTRSATIRKLVRIELEVADVGTNDVHGLTVASPSGNDQTDRSQGPPRCEIRKI